ncbi:MAG TPA: 2'-5' RNA ligase family protein [Acidimicrobiales bacterium]|nr:2'-5' RNA ligase family protein [Acidimicrobiales bacterium]
MGTATRRRSAVTLGVPLDRDHVAAAAEAAAHAGLAPPSTAACPHVTLLVLLELPPGPGVDDAVGRVAARTAPFAVRARNLGVFDDGAGGLVLHVPVVRSEPLARLHHDLYAALTAAGATVDGYHAPDSWFPHVTLGDRLGPADLVAAVAALAARPAITWTLPVTELVRMDPSGETTVVPLGGARPGP